MIALLFVPSSIFAQSVLVPQFRSNLPQGPHSVGFRVIEQYDATRVSVEAPDYAADPDRHVRGRPMPTFIWYPARASRGGASMRFRDYAELYAPGGAFPFRDDSGRRSAVAGLLEYLAQPDSSAPAVQRELASPVRAFRDAAPTPGRFPVIVYAPGSNAPAIQNELLGEFLASQGYIFIATPSWGRREGTEETVRDLEYLVAFARTMPNADPRRVALMGQSLGGMAVVLAAARNPSIAAVISLDGTMVYQNKLLTEALSPRALREYAVPSLFMTQAPLAPWMRDVFRADSTFAFFDGLHYADAYRVSFPRLRHRNFTSLANRLLAPGEESLGNDSLEFNPDRAVASADYDVMATYALRFLDAYLKVDPVSRAFLTRSPMEHGYPPNVVTTMYKKGWPDRYALVRRLQSASADEIVAAREQIKANVPDYSDLDEQSLNDWAKVLVGSRPADALAAARVMTTLHPTFARGFVTAGVADVAAAGDSASAVRHFKRALELDSSMVWLRGWITQYEQRAPR